jgi:hypothetical protein
MGNAFHKKKMPLGRGTKTHGIGISYIEPAPPTRKPTAEEVAARKQEWDAAAAKRGIREHNVYWLMWVAGYALDAWEDSVLGEGAKVDATIARAMAMVNTAVTKCCDKDGIDVDRLMRTFEKKSVISNSDLVAALGFVSKRFSSMFKKLQVI